MSCGLSVDFIISGISILDTSVPFYPRFKWPKIAPPLSEEQRALTDDFMKHWHEVLPQRYGAIERFNHTYPLRHLPDLDKWRTLELGAGIGAHLEFEPLDRQEYHCIELRDAMADEIRRRFPSAITVTGDCQKRIPFDDNYFDRVVVIHVLEHLPDLPTAISEVHRVLKPGGIFSVVLPCDPGLAYEFARKISAERIFKTRYNMSYRWFVRREHLNSPAEIFHVLEQYFDIFDRTYFPLRVPLVNTNLCVGVAARKLPSHKSVQMIRQRDTSLHALATEIAHLFRFGVTGAVATLTYAVITSALATWAAADPVTAAAVGYLVAGSISYFGHIHFSFRVEPDHRRFFWRFVLTALVTFPLTVGCTWLITVVFGYSIYASVATVTVLVPLTNYLCNRYWVFRHAKRGLAP